MSSYVVSAIQRARVSVAPIMQTPLGAVLNGYPVGFRCAVQNPGRRRLVTIVDVSTLSLIQLAHSCNSRRGNPLAQKTIRLGYIGAGGYSRRVLLPNFRKVPHVELTVVANSTPAS